MEKPAPDPQKLLDYWEEWEKGEATPGETCANLKRGGLPELLRRLLEKPSGEAS